jgi:hypothetical protein
MGKRDSTGGFLGELPIFAAKIAIQFKKKKEKKAKKKDQKFNSQRLETGNC